MRKKLLITSLLALSLVSCVGYSSKYTAFILITKNTNNESSITFENFTGRYVFKLKKTSDGEGTINYEAKLGEGNINVFYIIDWLPGNKDEQEVSMFTITSGENKSGSAGYVEKGYKVTIVVDSVNESTQGSLTFTFSN